jgi:putative sterol carrier protein
MSENGEVQGLDFGQIDASQFASLMAQATDEQIAEGMNGPQRKQILDEIFNRMAEYFNADKAQGQEAVVHFKIGDRPDGGEDVYEVVVKDGALNVTDDPQQEPRVTLKTGAVDFMRLVSGSQSGPALFMTGKLKIEGDLMYASQIATLFRIPSSAQPVPPLRRGPRAEGER